MSIFEKLGLVESDDQPKHTAPTPHTDAAPAAQTAPAPAVSSYFTPAATATAPAMTPAAGVPSLSSLVNTVSSTATSAETDELYNKIKAGIDFEQTQVAQTIQKFLAPLAAIPGLDGTMKFKTAVAQAKAQVGLTDDMILGAFDTLKATLAQTATNLQNKAAQFEAKEITARQDRLTQIAAQITALQNEATDVTAKLAEAQTKDAHTVSAVQAAVARLNTELDTQKTQYAGLLNG